MKKIILATGTDIKNRFLIAKNGLFSFGPDIGDLSQAENFELFKSEVNKATKKVRPNIVACDLHPGYFSTRLAKELNYQLSTINYQLIQHHHAHIASVMQEHNLKGPIIGVAFDGTGYGQDGNSWGGEFLLVEKRGFRRLAHLKYRKMPGGDKVVYEPWRMVLSILGKKANRFITGVSNEDKNLVLTMLTKGINSPLTSSAGRLFDAAAALLGICLKAKYEAEGPIKLEAMCDTSIEQRYNFDIIKQNDHFVVDTDRLFEEMLKEVGKNKDKRLIATKFHNSMMEIIVETVKRLAQGHTIKDLALSGGVFQNKFLTSKTISKLNNLGFNVFTNIKSPVNDLSISLGQYYVSSHARKGKTNKAR